MPPIPLQAYNLCIFTRSPRFELLYMSLSLFFGNSSPQSPEIPHSTFLDAMIFSVIVFVSYRNGLSLHDGRPTILRMILEDSTVYFLVIFTSHLLSLVMLLVVRVSSTILAAI